MKILLFILLAGCANSRDAEQHLGIGAACVGANGDGAFVCSYQSKDYLCIAHTAGCHMDISCAETVGGIR